MEKRGGRILSAHKLVREASKDEFRALSSLENSGIDQPGEVQEGVLLPTGRIVKLQKDASFRVRPK
jgi:hypothetical protein